MRARKSSLVQPVAGGAVTAMRTKAERAAGYPDPELQSHEDYRMHRLTQELGGTVIERAPLGAYPRVRQRRNRAQEWIRELVAENAVTTDDLVWPVFVHDGDRDEVAIDTMPGVNRFSIRALGERAKRAAELGIRAIALFPSLGPERRGPEAREAREDRIACAAIAAVKRATDSVGVMTDVALDRYTDHGQDGLVRNNVVVNDETVDLLCVQALAHARAGADVVAPSDMMDGRIGSIRDALDRNGFHDVKILAYSAKFASRFYGPFRDAVQSASGFSAGLGFAGKRTYHMDAANGNEAEREAAADIAEGADLIMVKPGLPYLDVIYRLKQRFGVPTLAYHVSGEYAMLKAAERSGMLNYSDTILETMLCFKRAGADAVLTYAAPEIAELLQTRKR